MALGNSQQRTLRTLDAGPQPLDPLPFHITWIAFLYRSAMILWFYDCIPWLGYSRTLHVTVGRGPPHDDGSIAWATWYIGTACPALELGRVSCTRRHALSSMRRHPDLLNCKAQIPSGGSQGMRLQTLEFLVWITMVSLRSSCSAPKLSNVALLLVHIVLRLFLFFSSLRVHLHPPRSLGLY